MADEQQLNEQQFQAALSHAIATAPPGLSEADFNAFLDRSITESHNVRPVSTGGGRGTALDVRKSDAFARDNAPAIGASIAAMSAPATGGLSIPAGMLFAGLGGATGSALRGDAPMDALKEGGTQALLQGAGNTIKPIVKLIGRGAMRSAVPRTIAREFGGDVDIAQEALNRGAVLGSAKSAKRISGLSQIANQRRDQLAATLPDMPVQGIAAADSEIGKMYNKALVAGMPDDAIHMSTHARNAVDELGGPGATMTGQRQIARKDMLQNNARAALNTPNPRNAALDPQLYNAERKEIVSHMRQTPGMESALDEAQKLMALDKAGQEQALSTLGSRAFGGPTGMVSSPIGYSALGHTLNQGANAIDPNLARILMSLMNQRSGGQ